MVCVQQGQNLPMGTLAVITLKGLHHHARGFPTLSSRNEKLLHGSGHEYFGFLTEVA